MTDAPLDSANQVLQAFLHRKKTLDNTTSVEAQRLVNIFRQLYVLKPEHVAEYNKMLLASTDEVRMMMKDIVGGPTVRQYFDYLQSNTGTSQNEEDENTEIRTVATQNAGYLPSPDEDAPVYFHQAAAAAGAAPIIDMSQSEITNTLLALQESNRKQIEALTETLRELKEQIKQSSMGANAGGQTGLTAQDLIQFQSAQQTAFEQLIQSQNHTLSALTNQLTHAVVTPTIVATTSSTGITDTQPITESFKTEPVEDIEPIAESFETEPIEDVEAITESFEPETVEDVEPIAESFEPETVEDIEPIAESFETETVEDVEPITESFETEPVEDVELITESFETETAEDVEPVAESFEPETVEEEIADLPEIPMLNETIVPNISTPANELNQPKETDEPETADIPETLSYQPIINQTTNLKPEKQQTHGFNPRPTPRMPIPNFAPAGNKPFGGSVPQAPGMRTGGFKHPPMPTGYSRPAQKPYPQPAVSPKTVQSNAETEEPIEIINDIEL